MTKTTKTTKTEAVTLTADQTALVTKVCEAEEKVDQWTGTADERWTALMTEALTDPKVDIALRSKYIGKRIARSTKAKGEALTEAEAAEVTKSAKQVWKTRKSNVKNGGRKAVEGDRVVTPKAEPTEAERFASIVEAVRLSGLTAERVAEAVAEGLAKR